MRSTKPPRLTVRPSVGLSRRLLLGGGFAAGAVAVGCAVTDPATLPPPSGSFLEVGGNRLHYRILGDAGKPPLIALHGASGNLLDWTFGPAAVLAERHRVLLFDRPGLGHSTRQPAASSIFVQARLMQTAAMALGFGRAALVGHSFGGSVALAWATTMPESVSGLVLIAAPSQVWEGGLGLVNDLADNPVTGPLVSRLAPRIAGEGFLANAAKTVFDPQPVPPGYVDRAGVRLAVQPRVVRNNAADLTALKAHIRGMVPRYPSLPMPIALIHGTADTTVPLAIHSAPFAEQVPGAALTVLDGIGHMPHHVAPTALAQALGQIG